MAKKLVTNMLVQNVYLKESVPAASVASDSSFQPEKYPELLRQDTGNGFIETVVERDYPITPESVASYAESVDYRLNMEGALAGAKSVENLGDVSALKAVLESDPRHTRAVLQKVLSALKEKQTGETGETVVKEDLKNE
ncbi:MAG: hypothetical protein [Chaetfec virus UA24_2285]|nr:MAG: hypothetical protein [Chaetfec virus UA24_2285]